MNQTQYPRSCRLHPQCACATAKGQIKSNSNFPTTLWMCSEDPCERYCMEWLGRLSGSLQRAQLSLEHKVGHLLCFAIATSKFRRTRIKKRQRKLGICCERHPAVHVLLSYNQHKAVVLNYGFDSNKFFSTANMFALFAHCLTTCKTSMAWWPRDIAVDTKEPTTVCRHIWYKHHLEQTIRIIPEQVKLKVGLQ